jgi:GntR family transcriptional regulator
MGIWFQVTPGSEQPIYAQIVAQVEGAIARGELRPGDRLPPVRRLAEDLVVNPNTVAKAYRQMELSGLIVTGRGAGTTIADPTLREMKARDLSLLTERLDTAIGRALALGLDAEAVRALFEERLKRFTEDRES